MTSSWCSSLAKTICFPSGDHAGVLSLLSAVSGSLLITRTRCVRRLTATMNSSSPRWRENTMASPRGDQAGEWTPPGPVRISRRCRPDEDTAYSLGVHVGHPAVKAISRPSGDHTGSETDTSLAACDGLSSGRGAPPAAGTRYRYDAGPVTRSAGLADDGTGPE